MQRYNLRSTTTSTINETQAKVSEQTKKSRPAGYVARDVTRLTAEVAPNLSDLGESFSPTETPVTERVDTLLTQQSITMFCGTRGEATSQYPNQTTPNLSLLYTTKCELAPFFGPHCILCY